MKINRNKGNLQNQLQKMLQAGMENVESDNKQDNTNQDTNSENSVSQQVVIAPLHATEQPHKEAQAEPQKKKQIAKPAPRPRATQETRQKPEPEMPRLNAAQRHEVPDHNAKYAGEPIKSVGCRMPQSLYARMLTYKALNDSQLNRITLNDIIIEAVEKFMDENS